MKDELKKLKLAVDMSRLSVKKAKLNLKTADEADKKVKEATLKRMEAKLEAAEIAFKTASKTKGRIRTKLSNAKESASKKCENINIKRVLGWTGISIITVGLAVAGLFVYDKTSKDGVEGSQPDTV